MASCLDLETFVDGVKPPVCTSSFVFGELRRIGILLSGNWDRRPCLRDGLIGCELNSSARSYTFKVSEEDDSDHILSLNMVCLSEGAKDECNIVEVVGHDYHNHEIVVPVANLKLSCQPWLCLEDFQLQPPVTFRLCSGSGPVHLAGQHRIFHRKDLSDDKFSEEDEEDFSEDEESIEEEEELSPIKPAKKQCKS
ncbi:nucleoplasmin-3 isoform X2 [Rhineura floridana]|uniref:nucleoplasmin-3 isoform X2 n=1 Tax=Rhineura floridana TaxID=261503 RepID=UPI002AC8274C|nr:nucleoplasmin-3 isoform X2 [Rhineura floridana]